MAAGSRWREIADNLQRRILAEEEFTAVDGGRVKLPTELELMEEYSAARNTIREALAWLVERGYLESERGKGTFVVFRPETLHITLSLPDQGVVRPEADVGPGGGEGKRWVKDAEIEGRNPSQGDIDIGVKKASPEVARYLQIPENAPVILRHQEMRVDNRPWALQTSYYPQEFSEKAPRLLDPNDIPEGTVAYLRQTYGYVQGGYHDEINVRLPDETETKTFGLSERASVLVYETFRTAYDEETGKPFRFTVTVWPADRNRLHYNVGKVPKTVAERPSGRHLPD